MTSHDSHGEKGKRLFSELKSQTNPVGWPRSFGKMGDTGEPCRVIQHPIWWVHLHTQILRFVEVMIWFIKIPKNCLLINSAGKTDENPMEQFRWFPSKAMKSPSKMFQPVDGWQDEDSCLLRFIFGFSHWQDFATCRTHIFVVRLQVIPACSRDVHLTHHMVQPSNSREFWRNSPLESKGKS